MGIFFYIQGVLERRDGALIFNNYPGNRYFFLFFSDLEIWWSGILLWMISQVNSKQNLYNFILKFNCVDTEGIPRWEIRPLSQRFAVRWRVFSKLSLYMRCQDLGNHVQIVQKNIVNVHWTTQKKECLFVNALFSWICPKHRYEARFTSTFLQNPVGKGNKDSKLWTTYEKRLNLARRILELINEVINFFYHVKTIYAKLQTEVTSTSSLSRVLLERWRSLLSINFWSL